MRCFHSCWSLSAPRSLVSMVVLLGLFAVEIAHAEEVRWFRYTSCDPGLSSFSTQQQQDPFRVACGALGTYYFGPGDFESSGSCSSASHGDEVPALYLSQDDPRFLPSGAEWFPCKSGGCFGRRSQPWVAVVDWNQGHGWSVAGLIREVAGSGVDLVLFPLERTSGLAAADGVSDLDVLIQLCAVAEAAYQAPQDLPLAVNMSFGRLLDPSVSQSAGLVGRWAFQDEIGRVLDHEFHQRAFAAAADLAAVDRLGVLDRARRRQTGLRRLHQSTSAASRSGGIGAPRSRKRLRQIVRNIFSAVLACRMNVSLCLLSPPRRGE